MTCLCSAKLEALAELLVSLEAPAIGIPGPLAELSAMMSAALSAQMSAGASLGLSAAAMAQLSAMAQATACAQAGLGINLAGPNAQVELDLAIALANANAAAFAPFGALDPAPWLSQLTGPFGVRPGLISEQMKNAFQLSLPNQHIKKDTTRLPCTKFPNRATYRNCEVRISNRITPGEIPFISEFRETPSNMRWMVGGYLIKPTPGLWGREHSFRFVPLRPLAR